MNPTEQEVEEAEAEAVYIPRGRKWESELRSSRMRPASKITYNTHGVASALKERSYSSKKARSKAKHAVKAARKDSVK